MQVGKKILFTSCRTFQHLHSCCLMCVCSNPNNPSPSKTTTKNDCSFLISNLTQRVAMRRRADYAAGLLLSGRRFGSRTRGVSLRCGPSGSQCSKYYPGGKLNLQLKTRIFFQYLGNNCLMIFHTFDIAGFLHFFNSFRAM